MNDTTTTAPLAAAAADSTETTPTTTPAVKTPGKKRAKGRGKGKKVSNLKLKRVGDKDHRVDLSHYTKAKSASGNASLHNGDPVAKQLEGKDLDEVYALAAKTLRETQKALRERYKHLNQGMQRMNLGNRIRGAMAE